MRKSDHKMERIGSAFECNSNENTSTFNFVNQVSERQRRIYKVFPFDIVRSIIPYFKPQMNWNLSKNKSSIQFSITDYLFIF